MTANATLNGQKTTTDVPALCLELQNLQRQRAVIIKSRNMQANRLQAVVAGALGYSPSLPEDTRYKKFREAATLIKAIGKGKGDQAFVFRRIVQTTLKGIDEFNAHKVELEKAMQARAKLLPVSEWVTHPDRRGFGILFLGIVIGETGDLSNYSNPAKVWKRLGCAPFSFEGKMKMGATWKSGKEGKLPKDVWTECGYSPRRRSISYLIGEGMMKQNFEALAGPVTENEAELSRAGPYRTRYDEAKAAAKIAHPDWPDLRAHRHGMLLATKRLLRDLWIEWNGRSAIAGV